MKKVLLLAAAALCIGLTSSCSKDNKNDKDEDKAEIVDLGGGIYTINGYRFVDLGLPSGLLWAESNVGASSDTEAGTKVAWGETQTKEKYDASTYKYGTGADNYTKYCEADGKKVLDAEDDLATVVLGAPCRMPLASEFVELVKGGYTTCEWTSKTAADGTVVNGYEVKSNANGNTVFFPGVRYVSSGNDQAEYWCADLYESEYYAFDYELATHRLFNEAAGPNGGGGVDRYCSSEIRPVATISK